MNTNIRLVNSSLVWRESARKMEKKANKTDSSHKKYSKTRQNIFNFQLRVGSNTVSLGFCLIFALWLVHTTHVTLSTNQMQEWGQFRLYFPHFPAQALTLCGCLRYLSLPLLVLMNILVVALRLLTEVSLKWNLTLSTLTSVCIFSVLFSIHFLKHWQGEFV